MLQLRIEDAIIYSLDESKHIQDILPIYGWDDNKAKTNLIKGRISTHTLRVQNIQCVYCERLFIKLSPQIEHIADKATYKQFSYEPLNLAVACSDCNGPGNKHSEDTIEVINENYKDCTFKMVHPYLDNVEEHFVLLSGGDVIYDFEKCTDKGRFTIKMLNMNSYEWVCMYARIQEDKTKPLEIDMERLILEISTYK